MGQRIKLPNFLIVGAAKAGTTSIFHYLNQHPEIFIPEKKECLFFSNLKGRFQGPSYDKKLEQKVTESFEEYKSLFKNVRDEKAVGDISHDYLYYYQESIRNIKHYLGDEIKIVIILRNPVERAYSHYLHHVKGGCSPDRSFETALKREERRIEDQWSWNWHYKHVGLYYEQVAAYMENFRNVKVFIYEDYKDDMLGLLKELYAFLEVDISFTPDVTKVFNKAAIPVRRVLNTFLKQRRTVTKSISSLLDFMNVKKERRRRILDILHNKNVYKQKEDMKNDTRNYLISFYRSDIQNLEKLLKKNLETWLH